MFNFKKINNPAMNDGVCCSNKELQSGFNPFLTALKGGVLNPSARIILYTLFVLFFLIGCRTVPVADVPQAEERRDIAVARPGVSRTDELVVAFSRHNMELDFRRSIFASEAQFFTAIYEGLFTYHPLTLSPVPALAERTEVSEDRTQWTFFIRQNARFCNGDPVRAEDFRAAWLSMIDPARQAPYSSFFDLIKGARDFRNGIETDPETVGIRAVDDRTLVVTLNSPASFFPQMLCHHSFSPIHPSMIDRDDWSPSGENWQPPISNGPFRIISMNEELAVLERNNYYWDRDNVALNRIIIRFPENADEAARLWNSGEARWIAGEVNLDALTDLSGIQFNVKFATHYYFIRSEEAPFDDKRVRRAMALVLPWEELRSWYFLPAETLIFPLSGYPAVQGISEPDYEEALSLMADAGFENGEGVPEVVIRITPSGDAARVASLMANAWKTVLNFDVRIEVVPFESYFDSLREGGFTVASITWIGDFADPYAFLQMWKSDSNLNDALFNDSEFDALIQRSMYEEGSARFETLAQAEQLLIDRGAVFPLAFSPALNIIDLREIEGWFPNALDIHPFKYMSFRVFRPLPGVAMSN